MLAEETWFTASDAVDAGLADSVENIKAEPAVVAEGRYAKTPQMFLIKKSAGERTPYPHARERYKALAARNKLTR